MRGTKIKAVRGESPSISPLIFTVKCAKCGENAYIYGELRYTDDFSPYCTHISRQDPVFPILMAMSRLGTLPTYDFISLEELLG